MSLNIMSQRENGSVLRLEGAIRIQFPREQEPFGFNSQCKQAMFQTAIYSFILSLGLSVEAFCHI